MIYKFLLFTLCEGVFIKFYKHILSTMQVDYNYLICKYVFAFILVLFGTRVSSSDCVFIHW